MREVKWTKAQQAAIEHRGGNLLVSASAGSGKTTVMIERIVSLLIEGESLENMAVCTFTKASAADMRDKLTRRLGEAAKTEPRLRTELLRLPQAEISTLHSWCSRLLQSFFYAASIDPNFEILDEIEAETLLSESIESAITEEIEKGDADFLRLYEIMLKSRKHARLAATVHKLYAFAEVQPDPEAWLVSCATVRDRHAEHIDAIVSNCEKKRKRFLHQAKELLVAIWGSGFQEEIEPMQQLYDFIAGEAAELPATKRLKKDSAFASLHDSFKKLRADYKKFLDEKERLTALPDAKVTEPYLRVLTRLTAAALKNYSEAKKRRAYVDYGDLEHETLKVLGGEYQSEVRKKYKFVFIDEYQDINPLQEAILSQLTSHLQEEPLSEPDCRLFFVGDVKQSIYGFRMCAPEYFVRKRKTYNEDSAVGKALELNANFRSDGRILKFINEIFSQVMTETFGGVDYADTAKFEAGGKAVFSPAIVAKIVWREKDGDAPERPAKVYALSRHEDEEDESRIDAETNLVVEHVSLLLSSNIGEDGKMRPVAFSDIAILVRSRDAYTETLFGKLKAVGIPVSFCDKTTVATHRATRALLSYLRLIDNSADDVMTAAVLRSGYGGFTDAELAEIRQTGDESLPYYEAARLFLKQDNAKSANGKIDKADLSVRLSAFFDRLTRYRTLSQSLRIDELAGIITAENEAFPYAAATGGEEECAALSAYLDHFAACAYGASLKEYLLSVGENDVPLPLGVDAHSVRILTVHASKGLEFPFVLLCNLSKKFNLRDLSGDMILDRDNGVSLKYWDWERRTAEPTAQFYHASIDLKKRILEEEMRVLYVALTRAKYQLALFGTSSEKSLSCADEATEPMEWLFHGLAANAEFLEEEGVSRHFYHADECRFSRTVPKKEILFGKPDPELTKKIALRINQAAPGRFAVQKTNVTKLSEEAQLNAPPVVYAAGGESDDRALLRGNAYHKIMELYDFSLPFEDAFRKVSAQRPDAAALVDATLIEAAATKLRPLLDGAEAYREMPFVLSVENEPGQTGTSLVQGVVDLLLLYGDEAVIIDYKTTRPEALKSEGYRMQMDMYAKAVERILQKKVRGRMLYSFLLRDFVQI